MGNCVGTSKNENYRFPEAEKFKSVGNCIPYSVHEK